MTYWYRTRPGVMPIESGPVMRPVYVGGCLGWFHPAARGAGAVAVVLCPALGREARWTYRTLRQWADRLAAAGLPTLRFETRGTGDSADVDGQDLLAAWRDDLEAAADWLRAQTGLSQLAFGGIRFGAALAADGAARRGDVAGVAMLAPVLSGRLYARELRLAAIGGEGDTMLEDGIELDGVPLPAATLTALADLDLMRLEQPPAPHLLVMDESCRMDEFLLKMKEQGVEATQQGLQGQAEMLRAATSNRSPAEALAFATDWLCRIGRASATVLNHPPQAALGAAVLVLPGCRETALQLGPDRMLAGVLCEPDDGTRGRGILIVNTGGDPRAGIGRLGVRLARSLAARGIGSLRLDFAGLGDSCLPGDADGHVYEVNRADNICAGLDSLHAHGYRQLGAFGLCTGAYHVLHAATAERRLDWIGLVNLVTFHWQAGDVLEVAQRALGRSTGCYKDLAKRPETWARLLRGQVDLWHIGKTMQRRALVAAVRAAAALLRPFGWVGCFDEPQRLLLPLLRRGTRVLMLLSFDDPGVAALEASFGRGGRNLARLPGAMVRIERRLDHTLSRSDMQRRVIQIVAEDLSVP